METTNKRLGIKQGSNITFVNQSDIVYCNVIDKKSTIYFNDGSTTVCYLTIKKLITMLDRTQFGIPHSAYIVNVNYVTKIQSNKKINEAILKNSHKIPLVRSRRTAFSKLISENIIHGVITPPQPDKPIEVN